MLSLILIPTCIFILFVFLGYPSFHIQNSFITYIFFQVNFLLQHLFLFFVGLVIIFFFLVRKQDFNKKNIFHENYYLSFFQAILILIASLFFAFILLCLIAWI